MGPVRLLATATATALVLAGCATGTERAEKGPAPWAALVSPSAALKVVVEEVCIPAILDGGSIEQLALSRYMLPVDPRRAGSPSATRAWRLASYSDIHVFELPNGGCSASVEAGSAEELASAAVSALRARRPDFRAGLVQSSGGAERTAYCTDGERPFVAAVVRKTARSRDTAFLLNLFRAESDRPSFCPAPEPR